MESPSLVYSQEKLESSNRNMVPVCCKTDMHIISLHKSTKIMNECFLIFLVHLKIISVI